MPWSKMSVAQLYDLAEKHVELAQLHINIATDSRLDTHRNHHIDLAERLRREAESFLQYASRKANEAA